MTWKRLILLVGAVALLVRLPWRRLFDALAAARQSAQSWTSAGSPHLSEDPTAVQPTVKPLVERPTPTRTDPEDAFIAAPSAEAIAEAAQEATVEPELLAPDGLELLPQATEELPAETTPRELAIGVDINGDGPTLAPQMRALEHAYQDDVASTMDKPNGMSLGAVAGGPGSVPDEPGMPVADEAPEEPAAPPDDLMRIEGIGPRVSTVVSAAGYTSFADLAAADVDELRAMLSNASIQGLDPSTWPEQARLAADGRWDELRALQDRIVNGKLT